MQFRVQSSPHISSKDSVPFIMGRVVIALLPAFIFSVIIFGPRVLVIFIVSLITALLSEILAKALRKKAFQIEDLSALLTALLFTMTLPPSIPLQGVVFGTAFAIFIGKEIFGGLGHNVFNPALVGRAFLQAAFPVWMAGYKAPSSDAVNAITHATEKFVDALSTATPLGIMSALGNEFSSYAERLAYEMPYIMNSLSGNVSGSIGETSFLLLLLGGIFLIITKTIDWRIPLGMTLSAVILSLILFLLNPSLHPTPLFQIAAGGFALGAFFMATDMVTSPVSAKGAWIYAGLIGTLIILIREFSGLPEGVMFSILFANAIVPLLNKYTRPPIYGEVKENAALGKE